MSASSSSQAMDLASAIKRSDKRLRQCSALLNSGTKPSKASADLDIPPPTLHPSLLAVLAQLKSNVTALSLAFSAKAVTPDAAVAQLDKLAQGAEQLAACVFAAPEGGKMQVEWRAGVAGVNGALTQLCNALATGFQLEPPYAPLPSTAPSSSTAPPPTAPYLAATSTVWSRIDNLTSSLSATETAAVRKLWLSEAEAIDDAQREFKELLEADEGVGEEEENEGVDDGEWAELEKELGASAEGNRLSIAERDRVKALDIIVRLVVSLHARTAKSILPLLPQTAAFDDLLSCYTSVSSHIDDLVSELYAPQNAPEIRSTTDELVKVAERICALCREALQKQATSLEGSMAALSTEDKPADSSTVDPAVAKELKWLGLWQTQMDKEKTKWRASESQTVEA